MFHLLKRWWKTKFVYTTTMAGGKNTKPVFEVYMQQHFPSSFAIMKKKRHIAYESVLFIHFVNVGGFAVRWLTHTVKDHRSHLCAAAPPTRRLINCHFKRMEEGVVDELFSLITSPSMTRSLVFKIRLNCSQLLRKRATVFWGMTLRVCNERLSFFFFFSRTRKSLDKEQSKCAVL